MNPLNYKHRRAFSLVEVIIAGLLSTFLMLMVSGMWFNLSRAMSENVADSSLSTEARFALETLSRDLGGYLPGDTTGEKAQGQLVGQIIAGADRLLLCYDGAPANSTADWTSPDVVVEYTLNGDQLERTNNESGTLLIVARDVSGFVLTDLGSSIRIELTLERRDMVRTYTLIAQDP